MPLPCLFPSPNRFAPHCIDCNVSGVLAYGSRDDLILLDVTNEIPVLIDVVYKAHANKLCAVGFSKIQSQLLASIGRDNVALVRNICEPRKVIHSRKAYDLSSILEWKYDENILFFPAERGVVVLWNIEISAFKKLRSTSEDAVVFLTSSKHNPDLLAVGHQCGEIAILSIYSEDVKYQFRGHVSEIYSLSWSPTVPDRLLSTSMDGTSRFWTLGEKKPLYTYHEELRKDTRYLQKSYGLCHPTESSSFIHSSPRNEVGIVSFRHNGTSKFYKFSGHECGGHCRPILKLLNVSLSTNDETQDMVISFGIDNNIVFWSIRSKKSVLWFPTVNGGVNWLTFSPFNDKSLAISSNDATIKLWNTGVASKFCIKIIGSPTRAKIVALCWHPEKENILAFSVGGGQVGVFDIYNKKQPHTIFTTCHDAIPFSLCWGPFKMKRDSSEDKKKMCLYSCGGSKIFINSIGSTSPAIDFDDVIQNKHENSGNYTQIAWKGNHSHFAVGKFDSTVELYDGSSFTLVAELLAQKGDIYCLSWHPEFTSFSNGNSTFNCWLACSSRDVDIHVYDLSDVLSKTTFTTVTTSTTVLSGHTKLTADLAWSPHFDEQLASASFDGTVQIWNVVSGEPLINFQGMSKTVTKSMHSVEWSKCDPDVLYCGGDSNAVLAWKKSEQLTYFPPNKPIPQQRFRQPKKIDKKVVEEKSNVDEDTDAKSEEKGNEKGDAESIIENEGSETKETSSKSKTGLDRQCLFTCKKDNILFPKFNAKIKDDTVDKALKDCTRLIDKCCNVSVSNSSEQNDATSDEDLGLGSFLDMQSTYDMLDAEINGVLEQGLYVHGAFLASWKGNVKELLLHAAENKKLSDHLINLAPLCSRAFWLEMCEKYAIQLAAVNAHMKAVFYFLTCNKVHNAIETLIKIGNYHHALALARARLPESDPVIKKLLQKMAVRFHKSQNSVLEAECYLLLKEPLIAAEKLCVGHNPQYMEVATYLCKKYNMAKEAERYAFLTLKQSLIKSDWEVTESIMNTNQHLKQYKVIVAMHKSLSSYVEKLNDCKSCGIPEDIFSSSSDKEVILWKGYIVDNCSYFKHMCLSLKSEFSIEDYPIESIYNSIKLMIDDCISEIKHNAPTLLIFTLHIIECILLLKFGQKQNAIKSLVNILHIVSKSSKLLRVACLLLFPINLIWNNESSSLTVQLLSTDIERDVEQTCELLEFEDGFLKEFSMKNVENVFGIQDADILKSDLNKYVVEAKHDIANDQTGNILFAYFVLNFGDELTKFVNDQNLNLLCASCIEKTKVNDMLVEGKNEDAETEMEVSLRESTKDKVDLNLEVVQCLKHTDDSVCENITTQQIPTDMQQLLSTLTDSEDLSHNAESELIIKIENEIIAENITLQPNADNEKEEISKKELDNFEIVSKSDILLTEYNDKMVVDMTDKDSSENDLNDVGDNNSESENSVNELIEKALAEADAKMLLLKENEELKESEVGNESKANTKENFIPENKENCLEETSKISITSHEACLKFVDLFYKLMKAFSPYTFRDSYAIKFYLKDHLKELELNYANIVASRNQKPNVAKNAKGGKAAVSNILKENVSENNHSENMHAMLNHNGNGNTDMEDVSEIVAYLINTVSGDNVDASCKKNSELIVNGNLDEEISDTESTQETDEKVPETNQFKEINGNANHEDDSDQTTENVLSGQERLDLNSDALHNSKDVLQTDCASNLGEGRENVELLENGENTQDSGKKHLKKDVKQDIVHLQEQHQAITQCISLLQEEQMSDIFPNPFYSATRISSLLSIVISRCSCEEAKERLHELSHILSSWLEKFHVKQDPCKLCTTSPT